MTQRSGVSGRCRPGLGAGAAAGLLRLRLPGEPAAEVQTQLALQERQLASGAFVSDEDTAVEASAGGLR